MKITDVKVIKVNRFMYVKVFTDEGIEGIGECGAWGFLDAAAEAVETFKTYLVGQDPLKIEQHFQYMYRCFHFRGAAVMGAISAIDIALYDISGKYFNTPIYNLIGGPCRDKIRVYYHVSGETTEELVANCVKAKELGYTAIGHLSPFLDEPRSMPYYESYANMVDRAADRVRQIREAVGNDMDLCLEMHRRLKPSEAIAFSRAVEQYLPFFLEDPIVPDNFDGMVTIAERTHVPIATGERFHSLQDFQMLLSRHAMGYARTSVCVCGGITGTKKISAIAEAYGVKIVPHNPLSPVSSFACMHIATAIDNFALMELPDHDGLSATERYTSSNSVDQKAFTQRDIVDWIPVAKEGYVQLEGKPGLGIELKPDVEKLYPYERRKINTRLNVDGSVVDQ